MNTKYNGVNFTLTVDGYYVNADHKGLHRVIWEESNGEIPENYVIHHIDENKDNNHISNLMCMTRNDHMSWHGSHRSEETRAKIGYSKIGNSYSLGHRNSDELKKHFSDVQKERMKDQTIRDKISIALKGRTLSAEHRKNISAGSNIVNRYDEGHIWFIPSKNNWYIKKNGKRTRIDVLEYELYPQLKGTICGL